MAKSVISGIPPPASFNFKNPEDWEKWIRRFERYGNACNITDDSQLIDTLIYCMGPQAEDILLSLNLSAADKTKFDAIKSKLAN
ncbi:Uncharacterised protein r2_g1874 [Pycnogonum litorale]